MGERRVDDLAPGMILAEPAYSLQGVLLLPEKTELTEQKIRVLKTWGVRRLRVDGDEPESANRTEGEDDALADAEAKLAARFSGVLDNEVMKEILRVAVKELRRRHAAGEGP